ncbi:MAG: phosphomannomutase/phosphoglucomutase [Deltaproteobacteria bacterium]|nr:phosphomannomutase/phosphoglucomutase [Deltaproteobacteria bacterium]
MSVEIKDQIFREYDIRGRFGDDLTADVAECLGKAYSLYLREKTGKDYLTVSVGRDVRISSGELRDALVRGLTSSGVNCMDIGVCPTPLQYFSLHTIALDGGVMITGSHNPPEYNGFKISVGKETIHGGEIQRLKGVMKEVAAAPTEAAFFCGRVDRLDILSKYVDYHAKGFSATLPPAGLKRPVKVVIDAGNGTGGLVAPELLRRLGCEVVELFCEPDGRFPNHHPDPTVPENMKSLADRTKSEGADFGVGYDGDSDRIGVVDEKGAIIWGDQLMVVYARDILRSRPGSTIVGEVKCSQVMYDEIERLGGHAVMWKTGHSLIKSRMKELKASLAGEMSGHIFFADRYFGFDDAIYATCRLVEIMAGRIRKEPETRFSTLLDGLPKTFVTPEMRLECPESEKFRIIERLKDTVAKTRETSGIKDIIAIDGLRVVFDGGWALVRASNTQPVLVFRFEAKSPELLEKFKTFMRENLKGVRPEAGVPF